MFNPKGDGFPAAYDTPERQEEYKQFYLQCFNNFFKKNYQDETKCRQLNPEKPDVPLNKNDAFQKVQKRRVQEKR